MLAAASQSGETHSACPCVDDDTPLTALFQGGNSLCSHRPIKNSESSSTDYDFVWPLVQGTAAGLQSGPFIVPAECGDDAYYHPTCGIAADFDAALVQWWVFDADFDAVEGL